VINAKFASSDIEELTDLLINDNNEVKINFKVEAYILGSADFGLSATDKPSAEFSITFIDSSVAS
jgi:hypothetical protein